MRSHTEGEWATGDSANVSNPVSRVRMCSLSALRIYVVVISVLIVAGIPRPPSEAVSNTQPRPVQNTSGPLTHADVESAAIAVLMLLNEGSYRTDIEFGGSICKNRAGTYFWSNPARSQPGEGHLFPSQCSAQSDFAGRYHTHGNTGMEQPSGPDAASANSFPAIPFYLGTPCGSIVKWIGPKAENRSERIRPCGTTHTADRKR